VISSGDSMLRVPASVGLTTEVRKAEQITSASSERRIGRTIKVIHLATRLTLAGVGNVVASLVRGMPSQSYRSIVWCLEEADVVGEDLRAEGHQVVDLQKRRRRDFALFFRLAALLRSDRIDIIHCHDELSWFYGTVGAWLAAMPRVVSTVHGRRFDTSRRHLWEQKVLGSMSTSIVGVSASLREQVIDEVGISPGKVSIIRNGIKIEPLEKSADRRRQTRKCLGIPESAIVLGCVGRLDPVKNLDLLIEASAGAIHVIPSLQIIVAGEGPSKEHLMQKTAALGLNDKVHFLGLRKDVSDLLSAIDLYICSSDREGISLSILEAMAAERPVIATAVGGNLELIQHDETGLLIKKGDRDALVQAILSLSLDAQARRRLGQQARQSVEANFSLNRMLLDYDHLYQSMMTVPR
jgi:sugar transferase (PEP-CTERM/EpsH1 system associated)